MNMKIEPEIFKTEQNFPIAGFDNYLIYLPVKRFTKRKMYLKQTLSCCVVLSASFFVSSSRV